MIVKNKKTYQQSLLCINTFLWKIDGNRKPLGSWIFWFVSCWWLCGEPGLRHENQMTFLLVRRPRPATPFWLGQCDALCSWMQFNWLGFEFEWIAIRMVDDTSERRSCVNRRDNYSPLSRPRDPSWRESGDKIRENVVPFITFRLD